MYPKIGQNIEIHLPGRKQSCKSIIADIRKDDFLIALPSSVSMISSLSDGAKVEMTFIANENKYLFSSAVLGREGQKIPMFRVNRPAEQDIKKIQQRDDFRVGAVLKAEIKGTEQWTVNFSAGGMLCSCSEELKLEEGEELEVILHLPQVNKLGTEEISFNMQVRRMQPPEEGKRLIGFKFLKLTSALQERIIQFCFDRQRQLRFAAGK